MLKDGEYIYVKSYFCESRENDYEKGLVGGVCSYWNGNDNKSRDMKFKSIEEALKQVLEENGFDWTGMGFWLNRFGEIGDESERGCFSYTTLVDEDNSEATDSQKEEWKKGKRKLWGCDVVVTLGIRSERDFTDEEHTEL